MATVYASVLDDEEAWYRADLAAQGVPALTAATGGPFDLVTAHVRRLEQRRHALYLSHGPSVEVRGSTTTRRIDHEVIALVLWSAFGAGQRANYDLAAVEEAVGKVVARIHGPIGDRSHGGRWFRVGPARVDSPSPLDILTWSDAIGAAGAAHVVPVRYVVTEMTTR